LNRVEDEVVKASSRLMRSFVTLNAKARSLRNTMVW
jgi:hypothetical protein